MRLKLYEDAIRSKSKKPKGDAKSIDPDDSDDDSRAEEASPTRAATAPVPSEDRPDMEATTMPADGSSPPARPRVATPKSDDSGSAKSVASALPMDESTPYAVKARTEMVHRVLEGLRDEAFGLARDIGIESLTARGGLRNFITQLRNVVFPRAAEEARELFRAGQRHGALARQGGESMLSYVSRRRRWWKLLKSSDSSIELCSRCVWNFFWNCPALADRSPWLSKRAPQTPRVLKHYSGVHLKEGRSFGPARNKSNPKGYGKGKARGFTRRAYVAEDETQVTYDDAYLQEDEDAEDYDDTSYPPLGTNPPSTMHTPTPLGRRMRSRATRISISMKMRPRPSIASRISIPEEAESGHVIQLQLAANAAFGRAKGRKGKWQLGVEPLVTGPGTLSVGKSQSKGRAHLAVAITADDAAADLDPEAVMQLLGTDSPDRPPRLAQRGHHIGDGPQSFEPNMAIRAYRTCGPRTQRNPTTAQPELEARSDPPRTDLLPTTAEPEFYRISDPFGTDNFLGSRDQELEADYNEAILLESLNSIRDPFPGDSSDDGAPGSYNVEELDEALERQAAEDAQRELDEAFGRARRNLNVLQPDSISGVGIGT
eukprot:s1461_g4.t1